MEIIRVLNNNVVLAKSPALPYFIAMGKGIGFQKGRGDKLNEAKIERFFTLEDRDLYLRFKELLNSIEPIAVDLGEEIIAFAKSTYPKKNFSGIIHISLLDHISGLLEMCKKNYVLPNPIWTDIRRVYKNEFDIGLYGVKCLNTKMNLHLGNDEAAFIAMHFINAQTDNTPQEVERTSRLISDITIMVNSYFDFEPNEQSIDYYRFIEQIKSISQFIFNSENEDEDGDEDLYDFVTEKYPEISVCVGKIVNMINLKHKKMIQKEDQAYLILYIERLIRKNLNQPN